MYVKGYHRSEIGLLILAQIIITILMGFCLLVLRIIDNRIIICIVWYVFTQVVIIYLFAYESKSYYINNEGIYTKWVGKTICLSWSNTSIVKIEKLLYVLALRTNPYDYIICSLIPIRKRRIEQVGDTSIHSVSHEWVMIHPRKVVAIRVDDFKEGQLEEFWSYVPERLKK